MSLRDRLNSQPKSTAPNNISIKPKETSDAPVEVSENNEGMGILEAFFADKNLNSIYVSGAKNIFVEKRGIVHKSTAAFKDNTQLIELIQRNAYEASETSYDNTFTRFNYRRGINVLATLPPVSNVPIVYVKNYNDQNANIKSLQDSKIISKEIAMIIEALATTKINILIAGNPNSLKTTILSAFSKLLQPNCNGIIVDFKNEFRIKSENFVNYDFANLKNKETKNEILDTIFNINPDRIIFNSPDRNSMQKIISSALMGSKGILTTIEANSVEDVIDNISGIILKQNPSITPEKAKSAIFKMFDLIILSNKDESGLRTLSKITELNSKENSINDIFYLNSSGEHSSTGYIPNFYSSLKANFLSVNSNLFDENYKHTYSQMASINNSSNNLIKKIQENSQNEEVVSIKELDISEIQKKVQERFEELKKNAKLSEKKETGEDSSKEDFLQDIKETPKEDTEQNTEQTTKQGTEELSEEFLKQSAEEFIRSLMDEQDTEETPKQDIEPFDKQYSEENSEQYSEKNIEQNLENIFNQSPNSEQNGEQNDNINEQNL